MLSPQPDLAGVHLRELAAADHYFLVEMLHTAAFWRPKPTDPLRIVGRAALEVLKRLLFRGYLAMYHKGWGRSGDAGFVAVVDGSQVGAVWYRLFTDHKHGDGFVDEQTPELVIAVVAGHRGRGIGRMLMERIADKAKQEGLQRIALSVNDDNPARRLYEAVGYRDYQPGDGKERMILELRSDV